MPVLELLISAGVLARLSGGEQDNVILAECGKHSNNEAWGMRWAHVSSPNIPANSSFVVVDPKTGVATPQCLNVEAWGKIPNSRIWATTCMVETHPHVLNRIWQITATGSIMNPVSGLCLGLKTEGLYPVQVGDSTALKECEGPNASTWTFDEPKGSGYITHAQTGLCVAAISPNAPTPAPPPTPPPVPRTINVTVSVDGVNPAGHSQDGYVSFNLDWHKDDEEPPAWISMSGTIACSSLKA
jgi:hypothetical protein